ncbi:methylated-DNA--[protein]-cysteine S-methyltransferase [Clostridium sp. LY3-2]|uniref:methylated-DNA--[protein]-cysteine S-methyltransferase n=1 Tax=Clostridium sp. LY3-2 TaxID=2942482 RepID=UPI00215396EE|nr:methylated-DNA--[protein]-cysteine S-methyltransferase [Clostridium sp. LY3-2]MCR6514409.1 methylated-DNA--[protein]-cysteine S-methyltransferase [Clostridium sp. LY3-2]
MKKYIGYLDTDFGIIEIKGTKDYITHISFVEEIKEELENDNIKLCKKELKEYLNGERKKFTVKIEFLEGTEFRKKVWEEVYKIPYGETKTYKDIAKAIGNEKASRAVGGAINKNPICIIVGCHRVLGSNNKLIGYAYGLNLKKELLNIENKGALYE